MNDAEFNGNLYYLTRVMAFQFAEVGRCSSKPVESRVDANDCSA
jgi:hypothetical protein